MQNLIIMKNLTFLIFTLLFIQIIAYSQSCLPEGITFTTQTQIDSFQINYPDCTEIEGDVLIGEWPGSNITNLNGLNVITSIGGELSIQYNNLLTDLTGLENLISIVDELIVDINELLENLTGLNNLTSIDGSIYIYGNDALISLTGLDNVTYMGGDLEINSNPALISLIGPDNLTSIEGGLGISHCSTLTSLTGFDIVTSIGGNVTIKGNDALTSLLGLENLSTVGGSLTIGSYYIDAIPGGLGCSGNATLADITALSNLTNIGGDLGIFCNDALTNLSGLESLTTIGGGLRIGFAMEDITGVQLAGNPSLTNITALEAVSSIGGDMEIQGNASLTSLTGLGNIDVNSIENLVIGFNNALSTCEVQSICDYLISPNGEIDIHDNAPGCNSQQGVEEACASSVVEVPYINNLSIYPNPFSNSITMEFEIEQPEIVTIIMYNFLGEQVEGIMERKAVGHQKIEWDCEGLPAGIYFCVLKTNEGMWTTKMIKL